MIFLRKSERILFFLLALILCSCGDDSLQKTTAKIQIQRGDNILEFTNPQQDKYIGKIKMVHAGQIIISHLQISNIGNAILEINNAKFEEDSDIFWINSFPKEIPIGDTVHLEISFLPKEKKIYHSKLIISSNDLQNPKVSVIFDAEADEALQSKMIISSNPIFFPLLSVGETKTTSITITSTGSATLTVYEIRLQEAHNFTLATPVPRKQKPLSLEPGKSFTLNLTAQPHTYVSATITNTMIIITNEASPLQINEIPIMAQIGIPPVADAGENQVIDPWNAVYLNGSNSYDPDSNLPLLYQWDFIQKPSGSRAVLENKTTDQPSFWADIAGTYRLSLMVIDKMSLKSIAPDNIRIDAIPKNAIHVQLIWDHPDSDLDLHIAQSADGFCQCQKDCYFADCGKNPNWFSEFPEANPRQDVDDKRGYGPENINFDGHGDNKEVPDGKYSVFVHYFSENNGLSKTNDFSTQATVRLYFYGQQKGEWQKTFTHAKQKWYVGDIIWPKQQFVTKDSLEENVACGFELP